MRLAEQDLPALTAPNAGKIDPAIVAALYVNHEAELKRFLWGVLGESSLVHDVLQSVFVKLIEHGETTREESRKAWLFRVAYHEALALRRRQATGQKVANTLGEIQNHSAGPADEPLLRLETIQQVRQALEQLPDLQQQVVRMRIYEGKTFAQIADELKIPLGTALGRMRLAVAKLREAMPGLTES